MAKMKERIGKMRHRVTLLKPYFNRDEYGDQVVQSLDRYADRWAWVEFRELRSDEKEDVNRLTSFVYARVTVRFDEAINARWRLVHKGKSYDILTVLPDEKEQYMLLECEHDVQKDYTVLDDAGNIVIDARGNLVSSL